jgi:23S rRNA G2445 N2-methylase RlmL
VSAAGGANPAKEIYRRMRALPWDRLWSDEVRRFDRGSPEERVRTVGIVRAVGVVFSESGPPELAGDVRRWLRGLLADPSEKIRRYAMAALPKVGAGRDEEEDLLGLMKSTTIGREKKFLAGALEKIGGERTLLAARGVLPQTERKARAAVARSAAPGTIRTARVLEDFEGVRIRLRARAGLEGFVCTEVAGAGNFRVTACRPGLVELAASAPFSLDDIFRARCFASAGFFLGTSDDAGLAEVIASPASCRLFEAFTGGTPRFRLDFVSAGHRRGAVRELANRIYALRPEILNDPRSALWSVDIRAEDGRQSVELRPRLSPDPRFAYRVRDVPAASHPPLAAAMARLAGPSDAVWDPFCGSGVELIECALLGARALHGTDRSPDAIAAARANFAAARVPARADFHIRDFRDRPELAGIRAGSLDLVITNPPLGMRVPVPDLRGLIADLFSAAATALRPGGRLVFANPLRVERPHPALRLLSRQAVDMSGFECRIECYEKPGR